MWSLHLNGSPHSRASAPTPCGRSQAMPEDMIGQISGYPSLKTVYQDRYEAAKADPEMQTQSAKLSDELLGMILKYRFPEALQKLQTAEITLNRKKPGETLTRQELMAYNDALNEFHLVTQSGPIGGSKASKASMLSDALRLNNPRVYKALTKGMTDEFNSSIHQRDAQQFSLLTKAILGRRWGEAHKLLDQKVDVTTPDITGQSAIEWASLMGKPKLVERMLEMAGDKLLPQEKAELKALAGNEEISEKHREKLATFAAKNELTHADREAFYELAKEIPDHPELQNIANNNFKTGLLRQANTQQAMVEKLKRRSHGSFFDFQNIDLEDADEADGEREMDNVFKKGMAALSAGKDLHPIRAYWNGVETMSSFGQLLCNTIEESDPRFLSAAHAVIHSGADVNHNANHLNNPMSLNNNLQILDALLAAGADPKKFPHRDSEPILTHKFRHWQEVPSPYEIAFAKRLIAGGADVNQANRIGETPLLNAAYKASQDLAMLLLENGADPTLGKSHSDDLTPLHAAAKNNHAQLAEKMLHKGAKVNAQTRFSKVTPLHMAASNGRPAVAHTLLKHGANLEIRDILENKAEDYAETQAQRALQKLEKKASTSATGDEFPALDEKAAQFAETAKILKEARTEKAYWDSVVQ